ncbi:XRE family transcriptional regulator [Ligilactobacillus murinus]|uniref:helix-turn-helix domain-containing protein n=1 Tax=Ligilactobacillus murinus TaxID=1622 RepID=UPI001071610B|nr:helix-turn-helix transcriptional regulator [Ligilactobacillus murinus]MBF0757319.1 helix-turn-helix transcriptional regulator [Ligilactobacillus murinus]MBF0832601.1 helix-turn-helix transcriptional regulator [Ligilactobacillus murinus]MCR1897209.1 helix-turn-helix transcriptional regulator [Ligilactobacillus murinus]TFU66685.1 XRE family transcriptional regulator [Ligilactobacillus murinus]
MQLTEDQFKALKRKRGELNLTLTALAGEIGVTRRTMTKIINHNTPIKPQTAKKVNDWIIKQYMND